MGEKDTKNKSMHKRSWQMKNDRYDFDSSSSDNKFQYLRFRFDIVFKKNIKQTLHVSIRMMFRFDDFPIVLLFLPFCKVGISTLLWNSCKTTRIKFHKYT